MVEKDIQTDNPIYSEWKSLENDIKYVESLGKAIISLVDRNELMLFSTKHGLRIETVTNENFKGIQGKLLGIIMEKRENIILALFEKEREETLSKMPKKPKQEKSKKPDELWEEKNVRTS